MGKRTVSARRLRDVCDEADTLCAMWIAQAQLGVVSLTQLVALGRRLGMHCDSLRHASRALRRLRRRGVVEVIGRRWRIVTQGRPVGACSVAPLPSQGAGTPRASEVPQ